MCFQRVDHAMQMRSGILDVEVLVLPRPALGSEHCTAMYAGEIPVGKFVSGLGVLGFIVVDPQVPTRVLCISMQADELIFLRSRRLMLSIEPEDTSAGRSSGQDGQSR